VADRRWREQAGETMEETPIENAIVLKGEAVEVEGLRIFGFPFTLDPFKLDFWAHKVTEQELEGKLDVLGKEGKVDILVSHGPPWGVGDTTFSG
jgi:Icc-related predicted phosphoesterase